MRLMLDKEQADAVEKMASEPTRAALNASETGCLAGGTLIYVKSKTGRTIDLVPIETLVGTYQSFQTYRLVDGRFRWANIANAWRSGAKQTFTVTLDDGRTIRASAEHPFLTAAGWKMLSELTVSETLFAIDPNTAPYLHTPNYVDRLRNHPRAKGKTLWVRKDILAVEASLNELSLEEYVHLLRVPWGIPELKFLPDSKKVVHLNRDLRDNTLCNLAVMDEFASTRTQPTIAVVVSIEPYGVEETYDIEVEGDPHNFVANGFVVHNTGKTLMTVELARAIEAKSILIVGPANPRVVESWEKTVKDQELNIPFTKIEKKNYLDIDYVHPEPGVYYVSKEFARRHDMAGKHERDIPWAKSRFDMVVADESHFASNRKAQTTKTMWQFRKAGYRLALSATPQGSNFSGFWALCRFLWYDHPHPDATDESPRWEQFIIDPSYNRWVAVWCETEDQYIGQERPVKKVIGPKGGDPQKFTRTIPCYVSLTAERKPVEVREVDVPLTAEQRRIYDQLLESAVAWLDENNAIVADYPMVKRIRLHQATLAVPITVPTGNGDDEYSFEIDFDHDKESPKAEAIVKIIRKHHPNDRVVVFTSSEKFTRLLVKKLPEAVLWTGPVRKKQRQQNLEQFLSGEKTVLIATYPAISEGLDGLQYVCHVEIRADEAGSVVQETQVDGRLNRRGQEHDIIRYRLLAPGTADTERVETLLEKVRARKSEL